MGVRGKDDVKKSWKVDGTHAPEEKDGSTDNLRGIILTIDANVPYTTAWLISMTDMKLQTNERKKKCSRKPLISQGLLFTVQGHARLPGELLVHSETQTHPISYIRPTLSSSLSSRNSDPG